MTVAASLLITRPKHEEATHYLFHWSEILVSEAEKRGLKVVDLTKEKANKKNVQSYMKKDVCDLVIFNGHGNDTSICGHDNEVLLSVKDGVNLFNKKVVFMRACSAAALLGPEAMKNGCEGFIGYTQPYIFLNDPENVHTPLKDELSRPFLECSNQVGLSLIKGRTPREAHEDSLQKYKDKINELSVSGAKNTYLLPMLQWNMFSQICY